MSHILYKLFFFFQGWKGRCLQIHRMRLPPPAFEAQCWYKKRGEKIVTHMQIFFFLSLLVPFSGGVLILNFLSSTSVSRASRNSCQLRLSCLFILPSIRGIKNHCETLSLLSMCCFGASGCSQGEEKMFHCLHQLRTVESVKKSMSECGKVASHFLTHRSSLFVGWEGRHRINT